MASSLAQVKTLDYFQWKNRLLLIYAREGESQELQNQLHSIEGELDEFKERDIQVILLKKEEVKLWRSTLHNALDFEEVSSAAGINPQADYQNVLIGKDGTVKLKGEGPISNKKLFNTIDSMPMRQQEMREQGKN